MRVLRDATALAVLVALVTLAAGITVAARELSDVAGFLFERQAVLWVWLVGLLIAGATFGWVARRSLRRADSVSRLWVPAFTAAAVASPLLIGLLQHPSP
jgi:hypothetical protein